jgi:peptide/nickel transport system substrate-binding protein
MVVRVDPEDGRSLMDDFEYHLYEEARAGRMTRADVLRRAAIFGISASTAAGLIAASGVSDADAAVSGSSVFAAETPKKGGTIRIAIQTPTTDVDPITMNNIGANNTAQIAGEYLCYPSANYVLLPRLATSWKAIKPDVWEFKLRAGVKFHSGVAMTADDVVSTFDLLTDPNGGSAALSNFQGVLSKGATKAVDPLTVQFNLDRAFVDFPNLVSAFNYNSIILPKGYQIGDFLKGGVGTGAYILQSYTPKVGAKYTANPNYWGKSDGMPYLDGVEVTYFDGTAPSVLALQSGAIDAYLAAPYQGTQSLFKNPDVVMLKDRSSQNTAVHMRVDKAPFNDRRVRQALAMSIDRPALVKTLFNGNADLGNDHIFAPVFPVSSKVKQVPQRRQDIPGAKALLEQAGHASGVSVKLTIGNYLEAPSLGVLIKQQAKAAGFNISLNVEDTSEYYGSGKNQPWLSVPFGITPWGERGAPVQLAAQAYQCDAVWNSAHWCNKTYNSLIKDIGAELDEQKRKTLVVQAAKIQNRDVPVLLAYWIGQLRPVRKNVRGLAAGPVSHIDPRSMWLA